MSDGHAIAVTILIVFIGIAFLWMCVGMGGCIRQLREYRNRLSAEAKTLRIYSMLQRLGISLPRYLRKAYFIDVEKTLMECRGCSRIPACDAYLLRHQNNHPSTFCPNFRKLERYIPPKQRQFRN